ncbi:EthD domain-containing protein [Xylariaceae sp. FL0804]|nr:EthD domain-containing protein [Xylariaceae sp. FL0804]
MSSVRVVALIYRKPDLTPEQFKDYYERNHMPLVRALTGDGFPLRHTRRYIPRTRLTTGPGPHGAYPATVISGSPSEFGFDCIAELAFRDRAHLQAYFAALLRPEVSARLTADCVRFVDMSRAAPTALLGDYCCAVTLPPGGGAEAAGAAEAEAEAATAAEAGVPTTVVQGDYGMPPYI